MWTFIYSLFSQSTIYPMHFSYYSQMRKIKYTIEFSGGQMVQLYVK